MFISILSSTIATMIDSQRRIIECGIHQASFDFEFFARQSIDDRETEVLTSSNGPTLFDTSAKTNCPRQRPHVITGEEKPQWGFRDTTYTKAIDMLFTYFGGGYRRLVPWTLKLRGVFRLTRKRSLCKPGGILGLSRAPELKSTFFRVGN